MLHTKKPKRYPDEEFKVLRLKSMRPHRRIKWSKVLIIAIVALGMMMITSL